MEYLKTYESFLNEATTDGSIESLIDASKIAVKMNIFDDNLFREMKDNMLLGVIGSLKGEVDRLPADKRSEFKKYADALMKPLEKAKNLSQFINSLTLVAAAKNNIIKRYSLDEVFNESVVIDKLKNIKNKAVSWWNENREDILIMILEVLAQIIVEVLFGIIKALLKSDKLKAPKIRFRGGSFGGGGASGKW